MARNYTREILAQIAQGMVPMATVLGVRVQYAPRGRNDPQPWSDGIYRYSGREIHTVLPCRRKLDSAPGTEVFCGLPKDHNTSLLCRVLPAV